MRPPFIGVDGFFWLEYRKHVGAYTNPPCGCDLNGPDRDCDLGWSLFRVAYPPRERPSA